MMTPPGLVSPRDAAQMKCTSISKQIRNSIQPARRKVATRSWLFSPADPGEHRLCASMQSKSSAYSAAMTFSATAGGVYYFSTKDPQNPNLGHRLRLVPVNPAEGSLLVASSAYSTFQPNK